MEAKLVGKAYVNSRYRKSTICKYEYRGHEYLIEYDNLNIKPSHIYAQDHRSEQNRIDMNIKQDSQPKIKMETADQSLKAWFEEIDL